MLVLNAGSSGLKWSVLPVGAAAAPTAAEAEEVAAPLAQGSLDWPSDDARAQAERVRGVLRDNPAARAVDAVGHRVVHGGAAFRRSVRVTAEVRRALGELVEIDPLHTPAALAGIDAVSGAAPELPQVAAFDTSFHATLAPAAATYPLPWEWTQRFGLRRYGFHGLSVGWATRRTAELMGGEVRRLLVCHLGSGCSLTAVAGGVSIDTSMGFTPLDGVMMATRSGGLDPGLLLHLSRVSGLDTDTLADGLQHHAGLAGVSGAGGDLRRVLAAADAGDERAALARDMFVHSLVRMAGAMAAVLGGLDALVLTGGIGEHSAPLRAAFLSRLTHLGVRLDGAANAAPPEGTAVEAEREISAPDSAVRVLVIAAREDLAVLRDLVAVLGWEGG